MGEALVVQRTFSAPPEQVFDAWLNPAVAKRFLFATPDGEIVRADIDARPGGRFTITDRREGEGVDHVGEYKVIERPRRLAFTFAVPKYSDVFTGVLIDIAPSGRGSELTLTHEGVLPEWLESTREGWTGILAKLDEVLGSGTC